MNRYQKRRTRHIRRAMKIYGVDYKAAKRHYLKRYYIEMSPCMQPILSTKHLISTYDTDEISDSPMRDMILSAIADLMEG